MTTTNTLQQSELSLSALLNSDKPADNALVIESQADHSKLFTASLQQNPLLNAAAPILFCLNQLKEKPSAANKGLAGEMHYELRVFSRRLEASAISSADQKVAFGLLSASLDIAWQVCVTDSSKHTSFSAAISPLAQQNPRDWFSAVIKRLCQQPKQYRQLLELAYSCLHSAFGSGPEKKQLCELIYQTLEPNFSVAKLSLSNWQPAPISQQQTQTTTTPSWLLGSLLATVVFSLFLVLSFVLDTTTQNSQQLYQQLFNQASQSLDIL